MKELVIKILVWLKIAKKTVVELDDAAKIAIARAKASGLLDSFAKIKHDLGAINQDLTVLIQNADTTLEALTKDYEQKVAELKKYKQDALDEIVMNDAVSARLNDFVK